MKKFNKIIYPPSLTGQAATRSNANWRRIAKKLAEKRKLEQPALWRKLAANRKLKWKDVKSAVKGINGIKGVCQLMRLKYIDIPLICPPEAMHSQYLGTIIDFRVHCLTHFFTFSKAQ